MKRLMFLLSIGLLSTLTVNAQTMFSNTSISFSTLGSQQTPSIVFNADQHSRFNQFAYNNFKINDVQVISVYEPNLMQDRVYFVDKNGNGDRWTLGPSSPANTMGISRGGQIDSLNPHGAGCIVEALTFGAINTLLQRKGAKVFIRSSASWHPSQ